MLMELRQVIILLTTFVCISIVSSASSDEQCQSLLQVSSGNTQCTPHGDCTGLTCVNSMTSTNCTFTVDKCQDPVLVNVSVTTNGTIYQHTFNQSTTVTSNSYLFNWTMSRNASYVQVKGMITIQGVSVVAIPLTAVPLNTSVCMCQSIQSIAANSQSPVDTKCVNNSQCTGLDCTFNVGVNSYDVETEIQPCTHPPGVVFIVSESQSGSVVYENFFNSSTNSSTLLGLPVHVVVIHKPYSMIISMNLILSGITYPVVPQTLIILDKTNCPIKPSPTTTPTRMTTPTPTPVTISAKTCAKIKELAAHPNTGECTTNSACDTAICSHELGYQYTIQLLPCHNPVAIHAIIRNQDNDVVYDHVITKTTSIPVSFFVIEVTLLHNQSDALGIQVAVRSSFLNFIVLPFTEIPLDSCLCPNVICTPSTTVIKSTSLTSSYSSGTFSRTTVSSSSLTSRHDSHIFQLTNTLFFSPSISLTKPTIVSIYRPTRPIQRSSHYIIKTQFIHTASKVSTHTGLPRFSPSSALAPIIIKISPTTNNKSGQSFSTKVVITVYALVTIGIIVTLAFVFVVVAIAILKYCSRPTQRDEVILLSDIQEDEVKK